MATEHFSEALQRLAFQKVIEIAAPVEVTFESLLETLGPEGSMPDGTPFPMVIEPWPGGRWYRDLGNNSGHFWAHVQVIKPPHLLEFCGPTFMSYPVAQHIQYRLTAESYGTRLQLTNRAFGLITADHLEGIQVGWEHGLKQARARAEKKVTTRN